MNQKEYTTGAHSIETLERATPAPLITFVSGRGGVGKSTLATIAAGLSAQSGLSTALVEADLQFGDIGFWFGLPTESPSLAQGSMCAAVTLAENFDLFKAPPLPETAEELADDVAALVARIRQRYDLVIADTGQFWGGLTAELVSTANLVVNVFDGRLSSVTSALRAMELCGRIGVPAARMLSLYNRWGTRGGVTKDVACDLLGDVAYVSDGRHAVENRLSCGMLEALIDGSNPIAGDMGAMLASYLPRLGCVYQGASEKRRGGLFA